jgi:hypothetical protein
LLNAFLALVVAAPGRSLAHRIAGIWLLQSIVVAMHGCCNASSAPY